MFPSGAPLLLIASAPSVPPPTPVSIWWAVVATVALVTAVTVLWWGRRLILDRISRLAIEHTAKISSRRLRLLGVRQIMQLARMFVRLFSLALILVGVFLWATYLLALLPATAEWSVHLQDAVLHELGVIGQSLIVSLPGIGVVAVVFFLTRTVHELVNHYFLSIEDGELESAAFDVVTAETTRRLLSVGLWIGAVIIAYPYIPGSGTAAFKGITVLAGLMLSLGTTNLVGQLVNGLVLIYTRTIRPGDFIITPQVEGTVERIGLFACSLRTSDDVVVTLPNSSLANETRNYSRAERGEVGLFFTTVTIGYDTPWQQVHELLLGAVSDVTSIRRDPAPFVRQAALEDFYVCYEIVFAPAHPAERRLILSALHAAIQDRFHRAGVQIMSPNYRGDPTKPKIPPAARGEGPAR